jgi:NADH-quinone oxidoreductase subunit J
MDTASLIFYLLAALLVISSLLVVFLRNVVHCAMALVTALLIIAILFVTLHAPMVGILQVMVYAGAIMVLFLFVIMFLNPVELEQQRGLWWGFGTILALMLACVLIPLFIMTDVSRPGGGDGLRPGDAGEESVAISSALRNRLGVVAGRDHRRGGVGEKER